MIPAFLILISIKLNTVIATTLRKIKNQIVLLFRILAIKLLPLSIFLLIMALMKVGCMFPIWKLSILRYQIYKFTQENIYNIDTKTRQKGILFRTPT